VAILPDRIFSHLLDRHKQKIPDYEQGILCQLFSYFNILSDMPTLKGDKNTPIQGMTAYDGFAYSTCSRVFPNTDQLRKHAKADHPENTLTLRYNSKPAQRFKTGKTVHYFLVAPQENVHEPDSVDAILMCLTNLLEPNSAQTSILTATDIRSVCPRLRHIRWQDVVNGRSFGDIRQVVAYPSDEEFPGLPHAIFAVFQKASEFFDMTPEWILQHIHSPDENQ